MSDILPESQIQESQEEFYENAHGEQAGDFIKLDQFLKVVGMVGTGGQGKVLIQSGEIRVNGTIETRRGRKLRNGDVVEAFGEGYTVELTSGNDAWA
jgi:ribosome-associated protein